MVGIGGLGHIAIKIAAAMGAEVTVFTTSAGKMADAKSLGAHRAILSSDPAQMASARGSLDLILDTVSADHDFDPHLALLRNSGILCLVGAPAEPLKVRAFSLIMGCKAIAGSGIGGIAETQEMLDFCAKHGITADVELIAMRDINTAFDRLHRNDVKYRFVIDMATLGK